MLYIHTYNILNQKFSPQDLILLGSITYTEVIRKCIAEPDLNVMLHDLEHGMNGLDRIVIA